MKYTRVKVGVGCCSSNNKDCVGRQEMIYAESMRV